MVLTSINKDRLTVNSAKGLAILAVVVIHLLTLATSDKFTFPPSKLIFLSIDQFMRFCVPVFIFLSGFGLELSYQQRPFKLFSFFKKRTLKTLPLYFLWSAYFITLSPLIKPWWHFTGGWSLLQTLIKGQADYHLYFVPIIFKLYFVFALLKTLPKKLFLPIFYFSILAQLYLYTVFTLKTPLIPDQVQYSYIFSWNAYFMLGMFLAGKEKFLSQKTALTLFITGLVLSIVEASRIVTLTSDAIFAMRFAKLSNLFFSIGTIGLFLTSNSKLLKNKYTNWLGQNSYLIYLAHPLVIHLIKLDASPVSLLPTLASYFGLILLSIIIQKKS